MIFNAGMNALLHPGALQEFPDAAFTRQRSSGFLSRRRSALRNSDCARNDTALEIRRSSLFKIKCSYQKRGKHGLRSGADSRTGSRERGRELAISDFPEDPGGGWSRKLMSASLRRPAACGQGSIAPNVRTAVSRFGPPSVRKKSTGWRAVLKWRGKSSLRAIWSAQSRAMTIPGLHAPLRVHS